MGEDLKKFLEAVGALTELWVVVYKNFRAQGLEHKMAVEFTKAMIDSILNMSNN